MRARERPWARPGDRRRKPPKPSAPPRGRIPLAVLGAHLAGLPLNRELVALGASFVDEVETTPDYRLYALADAEPTKPGLIRVADGAGASIKAEVWALDPESFGAFVAKIPAPLGIGTIRLADGSSVKGFLVEPEGVAGADRHFGLWRLAGLSRIARDPRLRRRVQPRVRWIAAPRRA